MLEAGQHESNCFITLTYSDDQLPDDNAINPRELSLFFKRLRKATPEKIRYFACGEYGSLTGRPHYHAAVFGYASCERGRTDQRPGRECCARCDRILSAWNKGAVDCAPLETGSAAYIAGYVANKYNRNSGYGNRQRPFIRMSNRPGIGVGVMHEVASTLLQHNLEKTLIDVPLSLQHGKHQWPLGRFLRRKLRTFIGREPNAPKEIIDIQAAELQVMREAAWDHAASVTQTILDQSLGRRIQLEAKIRRRKREAI